jgi:hypothetical protein
VYEVTKHLGTSLAAKRRPAYERPRWTRRTGQPERLAGTRTHCSPAILMRKTLYHLVNIAPFRRSHERQQHDAEVRGNAGFPAGS